MFRTTKTPILGMVQNMSLFICPHCHKGTHIFGEPSSSSATTNSSSLSTDSAHHHQNIGVIKTCEEYDIQFLGDIPLHASICHDADRGKPTVVSEPGSERAKAYEEIMEKVGKEVGLF